MSGVGQSAEKDAPVCRCDYAYIGTQQVPEPIRCERCGGLVDDVAAARLDAVMSEAEARPTRPIPPADSDDVCWCDGPDCGQTPCVEAQGSSRVLPPEESVAEMLARVAAEEEVHADTDRPHYRNRVTPPAEGCTCGRDTYDGPGKQWLSHAPNCRVLPPAVTEADS